jgi:hypothetical protein
MVNRTPDGAFRALANSHRRRLLLGLLEHNPQKDLTLPVDIAFESEAADELRTELYHNHLPMLERLGFVEWDHQSMTVIKGAGFDEIRPLLEFIGRHRDELPDGWL